MKKSLFPIVLLILLSTIYLKAQSGRLSGTVVDIETTENIPFASVALFSADKGSPVKGTVSDNNGHFVIEEIPFGSYHLMISFIGYETDSSNVVEISREKHRVDLGKVGLGISKVALE